MRLFMCALFLTVSVFAAEVTLVRPINEKTNLTVTVPEGFKSLISSSEWEKAPILEFIPESEDVETWSEIITLHKLDGTGIQAGQMTEGLKNTFASKTDNFHLYEITSSPEEGFNHSSLFVAYDYRGHREVFGTNYYSGPENAVGIQVTFRTKKGETDEQLIQKIRDYFKAHTKLN